MYVRGEGEQGKLGVFLARNEAIKPNGEIPTYDDLKKAALFSLGEENIREIDVPDSDDESQQYLLVLSPHAQSRNFTRSQKIYTENGLLRMAEQILQNRKVAKTVTNNAVLYDPSVDELISAEEGNSYLSTVVVMEGSSTILVFESGYNFIRIKTLWDTAGGAFQKNPNNDVIKLNKNGVTTTKPCEISEVAF